MFKTALNEDQRAAVRKLVTAKDYALLLGMPGTGERGMNHSQIFGGTVAPVSYLQISGILQSRSAMTAFRATDECIARARPRCIC